MNYMTVNRMIFYGATNPITAVTRLLFFAMHMMFVLLIRFKKKTAEYCGMMVTDPELEDVYRNGEENG